MQEATYLNPAFAPLYYSDKRYFLLTGGRGSLKSTTVHDWCSRITEQAGHGILFGRYTKESADKSIIPEFKTAIERNGSFWFFEFTGNTVKNRKTGSFIHFVGFKSHSTAEIAKFNSTAGITTVVFEEMQDFHDEQAFHKIDDTVRTAEVQNRIICILNPTTRNHLTYKNWIEPNPATATIEGYDVTVSGDPDVEHIHTSYHFASELGFLSESWLKKSP